MPSLIRFLLAALLGLVAFLATSPAAAYCRKTTSGDDSELADPTRTGKCDVGSASALPLYWAKSCLEYRIVVDPALEAKGKMTMARATDLVHRATTAWNTAQCPSAAGGMRPAAIRTVDVAEARCEGERWATHNEVRFTSDPSPDGDSLAVTDVRFDAANGGVLTAITRVYDVYAEMGTTPAEIDPRVEYIVRHEMGHFLGLAHSEKTDAVMNASFRSRANDGLTADDLGGLCEAYSPDAPIGAGCAVAPMRAKGIEGQGTAEGRRGLVWGVGVVALALLVLRLRRRRGAVALSAALVVLASTVGVAHAAPKGKPKPKTAAPAAAPAKGVPAKPKKPTPKKQVLQPSAEPGDEELTRLTPETIPESTARTTASTPAKAPPAKTLAMKVVAPGPDDRTDAPSSTVDRPAAPPEPDVAPAPPTSRDLYLGGSYRAFVMPRFMLGVVGRANKDPIFHAASVEAEFHATKGLSIVPALTFADLSTGDMLVGSRSSQLASSFSYVRSDLKALAGSVQLVWSLPVSRRVELELGLELGVGVTFGGLTDTWVHETADGPLVYGGRRFAACQTVNDGVGCRPQDHGSPNPVKVGDYKEPSMFAGGSAPTLVPWVSLPLVGVRTRIGDDVALRVGVGASATGIWAGASLGYLVARRSSP